MYCTRTQTNVYVYFVHIYDVTLEFSEEFSYICQTNIIHNDNDCTFCANYSIYDNLYHI